MSINEEAYSSDSSSERTSIICKLATAATTLAAYTYRAAMYQPAPVYNPPLPVPKLTGRQWLEQNLRNPQRCFNNLRMYPDDYLRLHDILLKFGLKGTQQTGSLEALGIFVWTCAHNQATRRSSDRFERSLDTVSRKITHVAEVMYRYANTVLVPTDRTYARVNHNLFEYAPYFDGCIGALDGTHIQVSVNREAKLDFINRKGDTTINVCAIVDMDMRFTFVGAGRAGSAHDMSVLRDCWLVPSFPHPLEGRYYLVDSGYMQDYGYLGPYRNTRYHLDDFRGRDHDSLSLDEKFNYIHSRFRNVVERAFGVLKARWQILYGVPYCAREKQVKIILAFFALHNYLWECEYGVGGTASYPLSDWVRVNANNTMASMREWIAVGLWGRTAA